VRLLESVKQQPLLRVRQERLRLGQPERARVEGLGLPGREEYAEARLRLRGPRGVGRAGVGVPPG
jgi:hypothetical protein